MPWYWILIIISAIIGPFEAMHALNKARQNRDRAEQRRKAENDRKAPGTEIQAEDPTDEA